MNTLFFLYIAEGYIDLCIYGLFSDAVSISGHEMSNGRVINGILILKMLKEAVVAYFKVLCRDLAAKTSEHPSQFSWCLNQSSNTALDEYVEKRYHASVLARCSIRSQS
jgi:hypothetical protein